MTKGTQLIDISEDMTPEFYRDFKRNQILTFEKDGVKTELKIVRLNKSKQICIVEPVKTYTEEEINAMDYKQAKKIIEKGTNG